MTVTIFTSKPGNTNTNPVLVAHRDAIKNVPAEHFWMIAHIKASTLKFTREEHDDNMLRLTDLSYAHLLHAIDVLERISRTYKPEEK